jgi:amino acid transporter
MPVKRAFADFLHLLLMILGLYLLLITFVRGKVAGHDMVAVIIPLFGYGIAFIVNFVSQLVYSLRSKENKKNILWKKTGLFSIFMFLAMLVVCSFFGFETDVVLITLILNLIFILFYIVVYYITLIIIAPRKNLRILGQYLYRKFTEHQVE